MFRCVRRRHRKRFKRARRFWPVVNRREKERNSIERPKQIPKSRISPETVQKKKKKIVFGRCARPKLKALKKMDDFPKKRHTTVGDGYENKLCDILQKYEHAFAKKWKRVARNTLSGNERAHVSRERAVKIIGKRCGSTRKIGNFYY